MAGEVMLLSNTIDVRQKMKEECNQKEFTIKLKKVIEDNWKIKIEDLAVELDILVKKTNFLTQSQRRALLKKPSAEEKMKQLLYIGLEGRKMYFSPDKIEKSKFVGREDDVSIIREILCDEENEQKVCYLYSVNGIGKTSLAKYIGVYEGFADYVELQYNENLPTSIMNCRNFWEELDYRARLEQLKKYGEDLLLIIENVNENYKSREDCFSKEVIELPCYKVFIFNHNPQEMSERQYQLPALSENDLLKIFRDNNHMTDIWIREKKEIINVVRYNTFLVKLCAKLLDEGVITTEELLKELKSNLFNVTDTTTFQLNPYEKEETYNRFVASRLYSMIGLDNSEKESLFAIWLFRKYGIDKKVFLRLIKATGANTFNMLIKKGWVEREVLDRLSIHEIIADCIGNERRKDIEYANKVDNAIYEYAKELINNSQDGKIFLSYRWILAVAELLKQIKRTDREYADLLILITRVCVNNFPRREAIELFLPKLKKCERDRRVEFYIQYFENLMCLWGGKFSEVRENEKRHVDLMILLILNTQSITEWTDYFDCLVSSFELIRASYVDEIKSVQGIKSIRWEYDIRKEMWWDYNHENHIMKEILGTRDDINNYAKVHSYLINYAIYGLKYLIDEISNSETLLEYITPFADKFPDVSIEMHRAKAKLALEDDDYKGAMGEIQLAYEESCNIDNQSYELECLEEKISIFKKCGYSDKDLLEDNQRMQILIEDSNGDTYS